MKKFQRIAALCLLVCLCLCLCACGSAKVKLKILDTEYALEDYAICIAKDREDLLNDVNTALNELIADGSVKQIVDFYVSGTGSLPEIQKNADSYTETLTMATNAAFPPYEYYENDAIVGIDASIAGLIADKLGKKLVISDMEFDAIIAAVQSGKADMGMAGMTVTEDRLQSINFTDSYATGVQVVIVREDSKITSVDDLFNVEEGKGYNIGVQTNTTGDLYTTWDLEDAGLATIQRYNKGADAVAALVSGKIDCVVIDNEPAKAFVASNNG